MLLQSSRVRPEKGSEGGGGAGAKRNDALVAAVETQKVEKLPVNCAQVSPGSEQWEGQEQGMTPLGGIHMQSPWESHGCPVIKVRHSRGGLHVVFAVHWSQVRRERELEGGRRSKGRHAKMRSEADIGVRRSTAGRVAIRASANLTGLFDVKNFSVLSYCSLEHQGASGSYRNVYDRMNDIEVPTETPPVHQTVRIFQMRGYLPLIALKQSQLCKKNRE